MTPPSEGLPAAIAVIAGDAQGGIVAQPLADTLIVRVTDATSRPVKNVRVAFVAIAGGTAVDLIPDTAVTNTDGQARSVWLLGQLAGAQRVEARVVGSPALKATINATALADQADTLRVAAGDRQSGIVGAALTDSLSVLVTDRFGNPIAGQAVNWAVPAGQGAVSAAATVSGPDGRAAVVRTLGPGAGTQTATATAAGLKGSPVSFTSTATAGGAVLLVKVSGDLQGAPAGFQLTDSLVVQVQDVNGNGVSGRNVNWVTAPGNGSASPPSSITNAQGMAYTYWTLHTTAGPNTLTAVVTGLPQVSFTATGGAAQPSSIQAASTQAQGGTVGQPVAA
ncbi:MAG: Ig-like domain-containing protein, partial [Gemmatimonadetes bacterium]|nr:Ig-like domain-containing protein [Gemmatimonadota bacterium]